MNTEREREDLILKIGTHEGPCLAVPLNDRQDYFGQTVNIASRVQDLAVSQAIYASGAIVEDPRASSILTKSGITPVPQMAALRGIEHDMQVYVVPDLE